MKLLCVALVGLCGLTSARLGVWQSDLSLWTDAARGSSKPRPWVNLGTARLQAGDLQGATVAYRTAQRLAASPLRAREQNVVMAKTTLGHVYVLVAQGELSQARALTFNAVQHWPEWEDARIACEALRCR